MINIEVRKSAFKLPEVYFNVKSSRLVNVIMSGFPDKDAISVFSPNLLTDKRMIDGLASKNNDAPDGLIPAIRYAQQIQSAGKLGYFQLGRGGSPGC